MPTRLLIAVLLVACGEADDGNSVLDARLVDGTTTDVFPIQTSIRGSLSGAVFHLQYGSYKRGPSANDPIWVCAADVSLTYDMCESTGGPDRYMFIGPFIYDAAGQPKWGLPQVWLYKVGSNPSSAWADTGSLSVLTDDNVTGRLELTLSVDFRQTAPTAGDFAGQN